MVPFVVSKHAKGLYPNTMIYQFYCFSVYYKAPAIKLALSSPLSSTRLQRATGGFGGTAMRKWYKAFRTAFSKKLLNLHYQECIKHKKIIKVSGSDHSI